MAQLPFTEHGSFPPCLITDRLTAGLLPPKEFTQLLLPRDKNDGAKQKWSVDLECDIEPFLWEGILKKSKNLVLSQLKGFHLQFLHRGFHYNEKISSYHPSQSPLCSFCSLEPESYVHLYWNCKWVTPLWTAIQDMCYDYVDMEDFSMFKCVLTNFQHPLLCLITVVVKNYIHVCKWTSQHPNVTGFLRALTKTRSIHLNKCRVSNAIPRFYKMWEALAYDQNMDQIVKCWDVIENY